MKAIRCQTDPCGRGLSQAILRARQTMGYQVVMLPDGQPYILGNATSWPLVARCAACKRPSTYRAAEFARLPTLTLAQLEALGQLEPLTRDWVGAGLPSEHAADMVGAGLMGPGDAPQPPPPAAAPKTYRTGKRAPLSGVYRAGEASIPLSRGEKFPPSGGKGVDWTLEREA